MRASNTYLSSGSQITKIGIVTALHLAFGITLINMKVFLPSLPPLVVKPITPPRTIVVTPTVVEADTTTKQIVPVLFVPRTEVEVQQKPTPDTPVARTLPPGPRPTDDAGGVDKTNPGGSQPAIAKVDVYSPARANAGDCVRPDYPARAAREGLTGTVTLALLVGVDGRVADSKIESTSGSRELDKAAVAALSMCKFKPARTNGVAEAAWTRMAYVWSLD